MSAAEDTLRTQTRAALKAARIRQTTAAAQLGISEKHLSQMLTGRIALTLPWAERLLAICGMQLAIGIQYAPADDRADP